MFVSRCQPYIAIDRENMCYTRAHAHTHTLTEWAKKYKLLYGGL